MGAEIQTLHHLHPSPLHPLSHSKYFHIKSTPTLVSHFTVSSLRCLHCVNYCLFLVPSVSRTCGAAGKQDVFANYYLSFFFKQYFLHSSFDFSLNVAPQTFSLSQIRFMLRLLAEETEQNKNNSRTAWPFIFTNPTLLTRLIQTRIDAKEKKNYILNETKLM